MSPHSHSVAHASPAGQLVRTSAPAIVDADVHIDVPYIEELFPFLSEHWVEHLTQTLDRGASPPTPLAPGQRRLTRKTWHGTPYYPAHSPVMKRTAPRGAQPVGEHARERLGERGDERAGARVGEQVREPLGERVAEYVDPGNGVTRLARLQREVLGTEGVTMAIASCLYPVDRMSNPDVAIVLAQAVNDWQIKEWLEPEPRLRGSIVVPIQLPAAAVAEIERVGDHPCFAQVLLPVRTEHPLGNRLYHPVWEAIERHDLVAAVHFGGQPNTPPTPTGWPSYFIETYAAMAQVFATQLVSIIVEGVFDAYPKLRVALLESGFTWLPAQMWRMDKEWKNLRRLVPWVRRPPSDYVREHVRVGIQPLDAPPTAEQMVKVVDQLGSEDLLMYTSDYPHVHLYDADQTLLDHLPQSMQNKIRSETARRLYRLNGAAGAGE